MADSETRHGRGLIVVAGLAVLFFGLLGLIVLRKESARPERAVANEALSVLPARIRVRTEPNARAPVVTTATNGEQLTMLEDRGAWVRVQNAEGLSGWAERAYLERTAEQQRRMQRFATIRKLPPLQGKTRVRTQLYAGPGIFYPPLGELGAGVDVTIFTRDHDFFAIARGDREIAYADVDSIDLSSTGTRTLEVQTASAATDTATTSTMPPVADNTMPPPMPEPEPMPEPPAPIERSTGVYSAVPPGGTQPEEIARVMPRYPGAARRANIQGPVVVRGVVRRDGTIDNLEVIKDLPYGLGDEARRAVSQWRFRPATYRGEPIDVYYTVTVNFRLQ